MKDHKKQENTHQEHEKQSTETQPETKEEKQPSQQELQELKIQELTALLQRLQADFDNFRKHTDKTSKESVFRGNIAVITKLLPIIDTFELALRNAQNKGEFEKGMGLLYFQLMDILKGFGLRPIDTIHIPFDPYKHEALLREENNQFPENTVLSILQKGYALNETIIRYAKVKVSKKKEEQTNNGVSQDKTSD
ncbi:nucleotide exchange factor GrpE [Candidatus Woesearchaeota archaeon]|nr:nucleotide exchange factor GrpE [Candidatus Woesearchaeota archaeon]